MKKYLLPLLLCILCASCNKDTFTISGRYTAPDGTPLYLVNLNKKDTLSTTKVRNHQFTFKGKLQEPFYAYVGQGRERVRFILEPGNVKVDIDERTEHGTPMVDAYNAFHRSYYRMDALRKTERQELTKEKERLSAEDFNRRWEQLDTKYRMLQGDMVDSIVRANPDNLLGVMALDDLASRDTARFMSLYRIMSPQMQSTNMLQGDVKHIRSQQRTTQGTPFIDYLVKGGNLDGSDVRLSDYVGKGKYILLDHWASWCGPCKAEMPAIKKVWEDFAGDRFDVVSVAVNDKREDTFRALEQLDMPWHQIVDAKKIPDSLYQVRYIPHIILFAPDGTIIKRGLRGEQIYATIQQLLNQPK